MDGLTELGNRWNFEDHLKRYRGTGVILFFDVDHFKMINDTYGHAVGDKCLCTVAQGLREVYGDSGRCFRMGADEAMYHAKNACKEAHMKETDAASQI